MSGRRVCDGCEPSRPAGEYYCLVCDQWDNRSCAWCWFHIWHADHFGPEVEEKCVRLWSPSGYVNIPGDHADRYRPQAYLDLLERYEWDEAQAPRYLRQHATDFGALLSLLQRVVATAARLDGEVYGPDDAIVDVLLRVLRSGPRRRAWRGWLVGAERIMEALAAATKPTHAGVVTTWPPPPDAIAYDTDD